MTLPLSLHTHLQALPATPAMILALRLTALFLVLRGLGPYRPIYYDAPAAILGLLLLLNRRLLLHPAPWYGLSGYVMSLNVAYYHLSANHFYLLAYWLLACGLALSTPQADTLISRNARTLLGLAFCFATLWKIVGGAYVDGSYFYYSLLTRFTDADHAPLVSSVLGIDQWSENLRLRDRLMNAQSADAAVVLSTSAGARVVAKVLSVWTLVLEGGIGVTFLLARPGVVARIRDPLLLLFISTTFLIIPIDRFAIVLIILGVAQCRGNSYRLRAAYLILFAAMHVVAFLPAIVSRL